MGRVAGDLIVDKYVHLYTYLSTIRKYIQKISIEKQNGSKQLSDKPSVHWME